MSVRKDDIYKLIDEMNEQEAEQAFKLLKYFMSKSKNIKDLVEADNTPLDEEEQKMLAEVIKEESQDWEDVKRELGL